MKRRTHGVALGLALLLTGGLGGSGVAAAGSKASHSSPFPKFVYQEMISIKPLTTLPLIAPTFVPRTPAFVGTTKHDRYFTATNQPGGVLKGHYNVNVSVTPTPVPVNSPSLDGMAVPGAPVASFGADRHGSPQQAVATLSGWNADEGFVPTAQENYRVDNVGYGIQARVYSGGAGITSVQWQEGPWTFEVNNNANNSLVPMAQQIVRFVRNHPLPASANAGLVVINFVSFTTPSRTHESIASAAQSVAMWTTGSVVYNVQTTTPLNVLQMTVSMRPFRVP